MSEKSFSKWTLCWDCFVSYAKTDRLAVKGLRQRHFLVLRIFETFFMTSAETVKWTLSSVSFIKSTESVKHFGFSSSILLFWPDVAKSSRSRVHDSADCLSRRQIKGDIVSQLKFQVPSVCCFLSRWLLPVSRCVSSRSWLVRLALISPTWLSCRCCNFCPVSSSFPQSLPVCSSDLHW